MAWKVFYSAYKKLDDAYHAALRSLSSHLNKLINSVIPHIPIITDRFVFIFIKVSIAFLIIYSLVEYGRLGNRFIGWDWLLISGVITLIISLKVVQKIPVNFDATLERLKERKIFIFKSSSYNKVVKEIESDAQKWSKLTGLFLAMVIMGSFINTFINDFTVGRFFLMFAQMLGAFIVGIFIGRMLLYARLDRFIKNGTIELELYPGHVDGLCGLKPLGELYYKQAMLVAVPIIYVGVWTMLLPDWPKEARPYKVWIEPYYILFVVAIIFEIMVFLIPVFLLHFILEKKKARFHTTADKICLKVDSLEKSLQAIENKDQKEVCLAKIEELKREFNAIENMPTWPISVKLRRRFGLNNLILAIPLIKENLPSICGIINCKSLSGYFLNLFGAGGQGG